jgi:hypothetical protein
MARRKSLAARFIRATLSGKIDDLQFSSLHAPIFDREDQPRRMLG